MIWLLTIVSDTELFFSHKKTFLPSKYLIEPIEMFWTTKLCSRDSLKFILKSENCFRRVSENKQEEAKGKNRQ